MKSGTWQDWLDYQRGASTMQVTPRPFFGALLTYYDLQAWQADSERRKKPLSGWVVLYDMTTNVRFEGAWKFEHVEDAQLPSCLSSTHSFADPTVCMLLGDGVFIATKGDGAKIIGPNFFGITGMQISAKRENPSWNQLAVTEIGQGAVVLIKAKGEERYLVAAKAEPGNSTKRGYVMLAAPLQASESNLRQAHGGTRPPRAELLDGKEFIRITQDGGRYAGKMNGYQVVEADPASLSLAANERWFTRDELRAAYLAGDLNEHLSQALLATLL